MAALERGRAARTAPVVHAPPRVDGAADHCRPRGAEAAHEHGVAFDAATRMLGKVLPIGHRYRLAIVIALGVVLPTVAHAQTEEDGVRYYDLPDRDPIPETPVNELREGIERRRRPRGSGARPANRGGTRHARSRTRGHRRAPERAGGRAVAPASRSRSCWSNS